MFLMSPSLSLTLGLVIFLDVSQEAEVVFVVIIHHARREKKTSTQISRDSATSKKKRKAPVPISEQVLIDLLGRRIIQIEVPVDLTVELRCLWTFV